MAERINLEELVDLSGGWDWTNQHVAQSYINNTTGIDQKKSIAINDIVESGSVLIAAGPADLDAAVANSNSSGGSGFRVVPIGLIESVQISQNKPLSRIFEIGSALSYIIPGKVVGGLSMSRVFFDGPSLLKALYMGEVKSDYADNNNKFSKFISNPYDSKGTDNYQKFAHIGSGNLAINLASSFFNQPVGLAFYFKDQQSDTVGQIYIEGCNVSSHNIGISAGMNVLTESVSMEFVRVRPIVTASTKEYKKGSNMVDLNIVSPLSNG